MSWRRTIKTIIGFLSGVLILGNSGHAQTPTLAGIAHAAIRVSDLAKALDFYQKLGFEEAFAFSDRGTPTEAFLKINDRQFIELYPRRQPSEQIGFMHVCFESTDLAALNRAYLAQGLSPTPVKRAGAGNLLFTMQGPEQQNIEYTQYMPDSMHSKDKGQHLGANRISAQIIGLGIEMRDPAAAVAFYEKKLDFHPSGQASQPGALDLPGASGESVEFLRRAPGSTFRLVFSVGDLGRAAAQLKSLHLFVDKQKSTLSIRDPDGNRILFVKVKPV